MISKRARGASVVSAGPALAALLASLAFGPRSARAQSGCSVFSFPSTDVPKTIPDPGTAESTIVVPPGTSIGAIVAHVTVTHPFDSDLKLELVSPHGKVVTLAEAVGLWGHDFTETAFGDAASTSIVSELPPFTGTFRPAEPLSAFIGSPGAGTWTLRVTDLRARYDGELVSWGLDVTGCAVPPPPARRAVGAPDLPPLPTSVPTGHIPVEGTLITVSTTADEVGGDTSSVAHLLANPGPDGKISLREAIFATNNDPGASTIRFAPALAGKSIDIGSFGLPPLSGPGVLIDGDIDGDGRPDVTVTGHSSDPLAIGLVVVSGNNRVHSLALRDFPWGILLTGAYGGPPPSSQTFAGNILSGVEVATSDSSQARFGILLDPNETRPGCNPACETRNTFTDFRFIGNRLQSYEHSLVVSLAPSIGDTLDRLTVAGNEIQLGKPGSPDPHSGIDISAGYTAGSNENRITDALVAYNTIDVQGNAYAISPTAGGQGGSSNTVEDLAIIGNRVRFTNSVATPDSSRGVSFAVSDGCAPDSVAGSNCSRDDVFRRVRVVGNVFAGQDDAGVLVEDPCCAGMPYSSFADVLIAGNVIQGIVPPAKLNPRGIVIGGHTNISNVTIESNTVEQETIDPQSEHVADLAGAGVLVVGGLGAGTGLGPPGEVFTSVENVSITNNRIDTDLTGIGLLGGGPTDENPDSDTYGHRVSGVQLCGNVIPRLPVLALRWDPRAKGINVIGGLGGMPAGANRLPTTTYCSVTGVGLSGNLVAGVADDVWVVPDFGSGASGNVAALGPRPRIPFALPVPVPAPAPVDGHP